VITQTSTTLTTGHEGDRHALAYQLDGREHHVTTPAGVEVTSIAAWREDRLVVLRTDKYPGGFIRRSQQTWSLGSDGKLTIEYVDLNPGVEGKKTTRVYRRKVD
jgi:hypothetical protein